MVHWRLVPRKSVYVVSSPGPLGSSTDRLTLCYSRVIDVQGWSISPRPSEKLHAVTTTNGTIVKSRQDSFTSVGSLSYRTRCTHCINLSIIPWGPVYLTVAAPRFRRRCPQFSLRFLSTISWGTARGLCRHRLPPLPAGTMVTFHRTLTPERTRRCTP